MTARHRHFLAFALAGVLALPQPAAGHDTGATSETAVDPVMLLAEMAVQDATTGLQPALVARWLAAQPGPVLILAQPLSQQVWAAGVEGWRPLVAAHFPPGQVDTAMRVLACESAGDPNAKNPRSSAAGLWQFIRSTWDGVAQVLGLPSYDQGGPYDPEAATRAARWLALDSRWGGWQHWVCY